MINGVTKTNFSYVGTTLKLTVLVKAFDNDQRVNPSSGVTLVSLQLHGGDDILNGVSRDYTEESVGHYTLEIDTTGYTPGTYTAKSYLSGEEGVVIVQERFVLDDPVPEDIPGSKTMVKVSRNILSGPTDPDPLVGAAGDYYIRADSPIKRIFGPKDSDGNVGWGLGSDMTSAAGGYTMVAMTHDATGALDIGARTSNEWVVVTTGSNITSLTTPTFTPPDRGHGVLLTIVATASITLDLTGPDSIEGSYPGSMTIGEEATVRGLWRP